MTGNGTRLDEPTAAVFSVLPTYIGQSVTRKEDRRLLTGQGQFIDDVVLPGMLHAAFVRSPHGAALIRNVDVEAARGAEGVHAVYTGEDLNNDMHRFKSSHGALQSAGDALVEPALVPLATDRVKFVGDLVAMVVATSRSLAEDAADLVDVDYEPLPVIADYERAEGNEVLVHPELGTNVASVLQSPENAALDQAFAEAAFVVEGTVRQHRYVACPMETRGLVASWHAGRGELTFYSATQLPHEYRNFASWLLGIPTSSIRVVKGDVGGGFGQKVYAGRDEAAVILATRRLGRPVKWIEDRYENLVGSSSHRKEMIVSRLAFDADHRLTAVFCDHQEDLGALPPSGISLVTGQITGMMYPGPYRVQHAGWRSKMLWTNTLGRTVYRGPWMVEAVAREVLLDVAARRFGVDPLELRRRSTLHLEDMPYTTATRLTYERLSCDRTLEKAAELLDYAGARAAQERARADGRLVGIGLSHVVEPTAAGIGALTMESAHIRITPEGHVDVFLGTGSHGQGTETTMAQIVASELGARYEDVTIHDGDTDTVPYGSGSATSRTAVLSGAACHKAAAVLRAKMVEIAAHLLEAANDDLVIAQGEVSVRGTPARSISIADIADVAYSAAAKLPPGVEPGLETTVRHRSERPMTMANATHACTVEVDPETFLVTILQYVAVGDCGVVINPDIVEGQYAGGIAQGIGGVFYEDLLYDESATPRATTFMDYLLPTAAEVPDITFGHVQTAASGPGGYKGAGEGGAVASPAALINAVNDALGTDILEQPLTPARLMDAYNEKIAAAR